MDEVPDFIKEKQAEESKGSQRRMTCAQILGK